MLASSVPVPQGRNLFGQVRDQGRVNHYSVRVETQGVQQALGWARRGVPT